MPILMLMQGFTALTETYNKGAVVGGCIRHHAGRTCRRDRARTRLDSLLARRLEQVHDTIILYDGREARPLYTACTGLSMSAARP